MLHTPLSEVQANGKRITLDESGMELVTNELNSPVKMVHRLLTARRIQHDHFAGSLQIREECIDTRTPVVPGPVHEAAVCNCRGL